ncbi:unnamed protein product [Coregonus sp. 'balchen']|nr:unnamed protein product [Coregonus sp. 'balchen']
MYWSQGGRQRETEGGAILVFLPGWDNISGLNDLLMTQQMFNQVWTQKHSFLPEQNMNNPGNPQAGSNSRVLDPPTEEAVTLAITHLDGPQCPGPIRGSDPVGVPPGLFKDPFFIPMILHNMMAQFAEHLLGAGFISSKNSKDSDINSAAGVQGVKRGRAGERGREGERVKTGEQQEGETCSWILSLL